MTLEFNQLRDRCGLGLEEVAKEFGETLNTVVRWENKETNPPDRVLRSLAIMADFSPKHPLEGIADSSDSSVSELARGSLEADLLTSRRRKSSLGQFMTPKNVADYMASLFTLPESENVRLLDAGAGQGALTSAFIERCQKLPGNRRFSAAAFEFDEQILPALGTNLEAIGARTNTQYELIKGDFIEEATLRIRLGQGARYTHAILNPPYKKISSDSKHREFLRAVGLETVNLYTGFVGLALELLEPGGELVAIIPRSFCNGPYYEPFRRFILQRAAIKHIHLFNARNKTFKDDSILQENVIVKLERTNKQGSVTISTSRDGSFIDYEEKLYTFSRIVFPDDSAQFIHIPTGDDKQLLEQPRFGHSLADLGLSVSTGPIVDFRLKAELRADPMADTVPLLYPGHFSVSGLQWPKTGFKKPNAIRDTIATRKWLYPNGFYTVVRRFSSKEERRRIVANVVDPAKLPATLVGFENHLNIFHDKRQPISEDMAYGLSTYLNATAVDAYFRRFNGHTQVNATDLRAMRYPDKDALIALGKWAKSRGSISQHEADERVNCL